MLYIVATPIGNLKEFTYRAVEVLNSVEYILCEDTRTSKVLLDNYNIRKPLKSYHKFNETKASEEVVEDLHIGKDIALISDAGMPGISDPGNILVKKLIEEGLEYTVVSGASAVINAFVMSGYSTPFTFVGFLPDNNSKCNELLNELKNYKTSLIFYCSPHSLAEDLDKLYNVLGNRNICVIREISKKFEEKIFTTLEMGYNGVIKGEFVVLVDKPDREETNLDIDQDLQILLNMGISKTDASKVLAKAKGLKKGDIYKNAIGK